MILCLYDNMRQWLYFECDNFIEKAFSIEILRYDIIFVQVCELICE